jgi:MoaA/NifB/PqqE/SkfB family radical SAM enzyme
MAGRIGPMNAYEQNVDFDQRPYIVIWEMTQACDLACVHCRACAQPKRNPFELSAAEGKRLIAEIAIRSSGRTYLSWSNTRTGLACGFR